MAALSGEHKRSKLDPLVFMPLAGLSEGQLCSTECSSSLLTLQNNVLEHILLNLHLTDLARCCQVSKGLQRIVQQDEIWQLLCAKNFANLSTAALRQWMRHRTIPAAPGLSQQSGSIAVALPSKVSDAIASYRSVSASRG